MRAVDIIIKKRDGLELSKEEIIFLVDGYTSGDIPDYQASAWAMAVLLKGMSSQETTDLTLAMANTGETLDISKVVPISVDKHSTGGVGDKTTITVAPVVAACGLPVGKMSGRGLGFSGGTLDKLESIPGFRTDLTTEEFLKQLGDIGIVISGQSVDLAPADGKLYSLRDVTGTVQSIPLIASSVMSKKIAAGAQGIVLDVKTGQGAFMETLEDAKQLAELMVSIGKLSGRQVIAVLSNMEEPLGIAVGNALELAEAVTATKGIGPEDYMEHCLTLSAYMLVLGKKAVDLAQGKSMAEAVMKNGKAFKMLKKLVIAQGGDVRVIEDLSLLPQAKISRVIKSTQIGWVETVNAREFGESAVLLGAGRSKKGDVIDPAVGILVYAKVGDKIENGDTLFEIKANDASVLDVVEERLTKAVKISKEQRAKLPLFFGVIGA
ncbi:MAG: thymidine phosphorylase [Anaerolineaceae bacterium]|nr:thymidine phosphorylase [Anaerolineaceae bacterium]